MPKAAFLVAIVLLVLIIAEVLWRGRLLQGEWLRKFVHASVAVFVAFWPWLISWHWIELIGVAFLVGTFLNRRLRIFHMLAGLRSGSLGDIDFALVIVACALLTNIKIFFCLAIIHLALADSAAALAGQKWGKRWSYGVWGYYKTVIGSMAFWFASLCILGVGGLFANSAISYRDYVVLLLALPPILTALENVSYKGVDNLTVPLAVVLALKLVS